jgi:hypothetical protein
VRAKATPRFTVKVQILGAKNILIFQDGILNHATVTLRHYEHVTVGTIRMVPHQAVVDRIRDFEAGECGCDV